MKFTLKDFFHGLMLAGVVKPANKKEEQEKKALDEYEAEQRRNIYIKLRRGHDGC